MVLRKSGRVGRRRSLEKDISLAGILFCVVGHPSATAAVAPRRPDPWPLTPRPPAARRPATRPLTPRPPAPRRPAARPPTPCRPTPRPLTPRRPTPRPPTPCRPTPRPPRTEVLGYY